MGATLADITCDSDGKIGRYVGGEGDSLPVHELRGGEDYFLGLFLAGVYQVGRESGEGMVYINIDIISMIGDKN